MNDHYPLPKATHQGLMRIGDAEIRCFVLEGETAEEPIRLLSGRAVTDALCLTGRGQGMTRFIQSKMLREHLSDDLVEAILTPVRFTITTGIKPSMGYQASVLPELCFAVMDAYVEQDRAGLRTPPERTYVQAKILAKAFSVIGIEALVDEATGFQDERDRQALQRMLNRYLAKEWRAWSSTFPVEFYQEIFRLRNWQWKGMHVNRPQVVAYYTTDLIYRRLAPKVLEELKNRVPRNEHGKPKAKLFCGLSEDVGVPALKEHLHAVTALMRASNSWKGFMRLVDAAFPAFGSTLVLPGLDVPESDD